MVDLDGARAGEPVQHELISALAAASPLQLQVGGGVRSSDQLGRLFDAGVARSVVGTVAVRNPAMVNDWLDVFGPDRITLALDVRVIAGEPLVAVSGWTEDTGLTLWIPAAKFQLRALR